MATPRHVLCLPKYMPASVYGGLHGVRADGTRLEVGGMQSTSNIVDADRVVVDTDAPLLWTIEVQDEAPPAGAP